MVMTAEVTNVGRLPCTITARAEATSPRPADGDALVVIVRPVWPVHLAGGKELPVALAPSESVRLLWEVSPDVLKTRVCLRAGKHLYRSRWAVPKKTRTASSFRPPEQ